LKVDKLASEPSTSNLQLNLQPSTFNLQLNLNYTMSIIDREQVRKVANLARLEMAVEEEEQMTLN
jgi:hypothetical protein